MVPNDNKTYYHLDNLGGLRPERVQTGTKTDCLVHLSGIGSEIIPKMIAKLIIWSIWVAVGPKCSKMVPKLTSWSI